MKWIINQFFTTADALTRRNKLQVLLEAKRERAFNASIL
jgi:hypothetical protein